MTSYPDKEWRELSEAEISKIKSERCIKCFFSSGTMTPKDLRSLTCEYIVHTYKQRGCRLDECTLYKTHKKSTKKPTPIAIF